MNAIIKACQKCYNQKDGRQPTCSIFKDPAYQWRSGKCWGRVTDASLYEQRKAAVERYTDRYGVKSFGAGRLPV